MSQPKLNEAPKIVSSAAHHSMAMKHEASGKTIHELLTELVEQLSPLYWSTSDTEQRELIAEQMEELDAKSYAIFKNKIRTNTEAWSEAADSLSAAIDEAEAAQNAIDKTVDTLKKLGQAIALVAKLLAAVA